MLKENKEKAAGSKQDGSKRSASAGRSDTIQEESSEDIAREAERLVSVILNLGLSSAAISFEENKRDRNTYR